MGRRMENGQVELPSIHFAKTEKISEFTVASTEISICCETSEKCLAQFKQLLRIIQYEKKKDE